MASNGSIATRDVPATSELGTVVEYDRMFTSWNDGRVFTPMDFDVRKVEEMLRADGKAKALEQVLTLPLRGADWSIEPSKGDTGQAEFVRDALTRAANQGGMSTPIELVIAQATAACLFRRAYFEKVFKIEDGRVVYDKLAWRPPSSCRLEYDRQTGAFRGFAQRLGPDNPKADPTGYVKIPPERSFVVVHGQHRRPLEGLSDLDTAFQIFQTKQKVRWLWLRFLENQSMPKAVAQNDSNDPGATQAFAQKVATLKGGGVVGIGPEQNVTPFESNGAGAGHYQAAIQFLDSEMSGSVLAGFTDLTAMAGSGRGSYALSKDASDLFLQSRQAVLNEIGAAITGFVVADLIRYNFGVRASVPRFKFGPLIAEQAEAALNLLQQMSTAAAVNPSIPPEFLRLLVEKVAKYLGMDESVIAEAMQKAVDQAGAQPVDQLRAGVDAAQQLVQAAGVGSGNTASTAA